MFWEIALGMCPAHSPVTSLRLLGCCNGAGVCQGAVGQGLVVRSDRLPPVSQKCAGGGLLLGGGSLQQGRGIQNTQWNTWNTVRILHLHPVVRCFMLVFY